MTIVMVSVQLKREDPAFHCSSGSFAIAIWGYMFVRCLYVVFGGTRIASLTR